MQYKEVLNKYHITRLEDQTVRKRLIEHLTGDPNYPSSILKVINPWKRRLFGVIYKETVEGRNVFHIEGTQTTFWRLEAWGGDLRSLITLIELKNPFTGSLKYIPRFHTHDQLLPYRQKIVTLRDNEGGEIASVYAKDNTSPMREDHPMIQKLHAFAQEYHIKAPLEISSSFIAFLFLYTGILDKTAQLLEQSIELSKLLIAEFDS